MSNRPSKELIETICVVKNLKFWKAASKRAHKETDIPKEMEALR